MTLLYHDRKFQQHETGAHPEHARRLVAVDAELKARGMVDRCMLPNWKAAGPATLQRLHYPHYVEGLQQYAEGGGGRIESDTVISPRSYDVAAYAAGAVCDAVKRVTGGEDRSALCLVRPPGHHARPKSAMGFCLFNNVALGARAAIDEHGLSRVLVVDWDVHHGNGTQEMFWDDGRVGFLSIHRWPFYPGTGSEEETGAARGLGLISNIPVEFGTPLESYHDRFERALADLAARLQPELILISAGFDAHRDDPIGSLELGVEDFERLTRSVLSVADAHAGGKAVSVLEGGYNPPRLADCVATHLDVLIEHG